MTPRKMRLLSKNVAFSFRSGAEEDAFEERFPGTMWSRGFGCCERKTYSVCKPKEWKDTQAWLLEQGYESVILKELSL